MSRIGWRTEAAGSHARQSDAPTEDHDRGQRDDEAERHGGDRQVTKLGIVAAPDDENSG
jgi:hypothetical protein